MDPVRVGLAGVGRHGMRYARHILQDIEGMELTTAMRSPGSKELPGELEEAGVGPALDIDALLGHGIDLLIIATPTDTHRELASRGLSKGVHVLLEKPMAGSVDECRSLIEAERASEGSLTIAHTLRYSLSINRMNEELSRIKTFRWFEMVQALEPPKTQWLKEERAMGGCVLNTGVHVFDTVAHFLGRITTASCTMERVLNPMWEDFAYGDLTLANGIEGAFRVSRNTASRTSYLRVDLEEGSLWAEPLSETFYRVDDGKIEKEAIEGESRTLIPLLHDMSGVARGEREPPITGADGMAAVAAAEACYSSYKEGSEQRLKS